MKQVFTLILFTWLVFFAPFMVSAEEEIDVELNLRSGESAYTFFDLTHGEATLIENAKGEKTLIDTGHRLSQDELFERLGMYHVSDIDRIIITNKQAEYTGNLQEVIDRYDVKEVSIPKAMSEDLAPILFASDITVDPFETKDDLYVMEGVMAHVLFVETRPGIHEGASVLLFDNTDKKLLFMSVADYQVETFITENYNIKSTVLKVAEFASERGTSQKLLDEADPQVAVIFQNDDELPSPFVLERLQGTWIEIFQTSRTGTVSIKWNDEDYEIFTIRPAEKEQLEQMADRLKGFFGFKAQ
ncbi:ComEC/Rec2 family competence protein [Alteribacter keqinensis]|uniref:Metallo-beta-lactamase domain-containing protein n=1 Tax=Alteribacter keqinensis TaxID=2483800 RepID=A0A3M7TU57_9BACI|nr:MBL fold metallo-hydrolase [Alteribacter keqinensis]RNA69176.1 hypothetical protein EBO34_04285 [Alteribacter keqinensis]